MTLTAMLPPIPTVSIGLHVYNGAEYLPQTLDDLLRQSFTDFELIVSDNCSTDETGAIVQAAAECDPRIRYFRHERNIGALPNANFAFTQARGRYYAVCAHDDRHDRGFLARLVAALDANPEAGLAYGRKRLIDDAGRPFQFDSAAGLWMNAEGRAVPYDAALETDLGDDPVERYRRVLASNDTNAPIYGLFRREVFASSPRFQIHGVDRVLLAHAALQAPFAFVDAPLFSYRIHAGSTLYLDRATRVARETGGQRASVLDTARTLRQYLRVIERGPLTPGQKAEAVAITLGGSRMKQIAFNFLRPGAENYWGLRRWPWQSAPATA